MFKVKPCGTFGVKAEAFVFWNNALGHALSLIEGGQYSRVMIGREEAFAGVSTYEPLGYLTREEGVLRWVGFANSPATPPSADSIITNQVRGYRNLIPCS